VYRAAQDAREDESRVYGNVEPIFVILHRGADLARPMGYEHIGEDCAEG
jgi:hypothetical protein